MSKNELKIAVSKAKQVGVIGSPSSTGRINVDLLESAITDRLIGNLGIFNYRQDELDHYALSQFTEITMKNTWSEDPTIRGLIRQKGSVAPITEKQDVHLAQMTVSAVFSSGTEIVEPSILGPIPPTGTPVKLFSKEIMDAMFTKLKDELFYLGTSYGTDIQMPMWFKHFGKGKKGAGEAYHLGVFGKTGSGKSILSLMIMLAYARHRKMSVFVLDPQGELSKKLVDNANIQSTIKTNFKKSVRLENLHNLKLSGWSLFKKILIYSGFIKKLGVHLDVNQEQAADAIISILKSKSEGRKEVKPYTVYKPGAFEKIWFDLQKEHILVRIYTSKEPRDRVMRSLSPENKEEFRKLWMKIANLFKYQKESKNILIKNLTKEIKRETGTITLIDLSRNNTPKNLFWNDTVKFIVIGEIIKHLILVAEDVYKENKLLNTLVVVDEAHRLAPREKSPIEDLESLKSLFIDGVRTTQKYGLGWMFISQTLSSLDRRIAEQIRIYLFGFGLSWGIERKALLEIISGQNEALTLYQMFRDPQSSLGKREYPFMSIGPISPLSFSGTPLFINALDFPEKFLGVNFP